MAAVRHCCATLLAAIKVEVEFGGMGMWRRGGSVVSDGLSWLWCRFCYTMRIQFGVGMLQAKALAGVAGGMMAAYLMSLSLLGTSFLELQLYCKGSLGENPVLRRATAALLVLCPS